MCSFSLQKLYFGKKIWPYILVLMKDVDILQLPYFSLNKKVIKTLLGKVTLA